MGSLIKFLAIGFFMASTIGTVNAALAPGDWILRNQITGGGVDPLRCRSYNGETWKCAGEYLDHRKAIFTGTARYDNERLCSMSADTASTTVGNSITWTIGDGPCTSTASISLFTEELPPDTTEIRAMSLNEVLVLVGGFLAFGIGYLMAK